MRWSVTDVHAIRWHRPTGGLIAATVLSLVSSLLVLGLTSSVSADPVTPDPGDVSTLCDSGSADELTASHGYMGAYVPAGATAQFTATGTVKPEGWFAGYGWAQYYLYLDASVGGTSVYNTRSTLDYYGTTLPAVISFTRNMGSWTNNTGAEATLLLDMWGERLARGRDLSWNVQVTITGADPANCKQLVPGMPLEQTFGDQCGCLGGSTGYQYLTSRPVNTATGSLYENFTDLALPGAGRQLAFTRSYNSLDPTTGPLGQGWTFGFNASLSVDSVSGAVTVRAEDGKQAIFRNVSGSFVAPPGIRARLVSLSGGGYRLTEPDQSALDFDSSGHLTATKDRLGVGLTLGYSSGKLATITDAAGRELDLTYTGDLLTKIALADGRHVDYGYTSGRLTSVTDRRGKTTTYAYDTGGRLQSAQDPDGHYLFQNTYDSATGRVVSQLDGRGKQTSFGWNASTHTATVTDPRGHDWTYTYKRNVLTSTTDPLGNTTSFTYDDDLNRTGVTDARGKITTYTYDSAGNVLMKTGPAPSSVQETWTYTPFNAVETYTNGRGKTTHYEYFANQLLKKKTDPLNRETSYTWTGNGQPDTVTDPRGKVIDFGYDAAGNLVSVLSPVGNLTTYGYDGYGRRTSLVEARGNVSGADPNLYKTTWTYNANDQIVDVTDALGRQTHHDYDDAGNLTSVTNADGKVTSYEYNADNQVTKATDPHAPADTTYGAVTTSYDDAGNVASVTTPAGTTTYAYDNANRQVTEVTPRGNVTGAAAADFTWSYTYDANGNRLTESNPTAGTTTTVYDELNRPTTVTDAHNKATTTAYDADGNVVSVTDPLMRVTSFGYDDADQRVSTTDPKLKTTTVGYDASGNQTSRTTPLGNVEKWTYDGDGRLATRIDPRGNVAGGTPSQYTTTYSYDPAGHLLTVSDPLAHATGYGYDRVGNLVTRTDARNNSTSYTYDVLNRLKTVKDPLNNVTSYGYDAAGNLVSRVDANTHTTSYSYDLAGRLIQKTSPAGTWKYDYDAGGNLTKTETAAGVATATAGDGTITRSYDPLDRLTGIDYSDSTPDVTFGYDQLRRTSMTDNAVAGAPSETYGYDDAGQLTSVARGSAVFGYAYDDDGRLTTRTVPDGRTITQTWDDDSRPAGVSGGGVSTSYSYDAASNRTGTTFGNGTSETRTYDAAGRLGDLTTKRGTTVLNQNTYTRDANGNPLIIAGAQGETYTYDADNRVASVCWATNCVPGFTDETDYTYDGVGNRTGELRREFGYFGNIVSTYNAADQLTRIRKPPYFLTPQVDTDYTYDANGNQTSAGTTTFSYDLANRVKSATTSTATTSYTYDGEGTRLKAVTGTNTTSYTWDKNYPLPELTAETMPSGTRTYLDDPAGDPISVTNPGTGTGTGNLYLHPDGRGSVVAVTDTTGTRLATYGYEAFGSPRVSPTNEYNATQPIRFAGEYLDTNTNRYHLRARDYDPTTGRFNAPDPIAQDITDPYVSQYVYANSRPTVLTDPSGLAPKGLGFVTNAASAVAQFAGSTAHAISAGVDCLNSYLTADLEVLRYLAGPIADAIRTTAMVAIDLTIGGCLNDFTSLSCALDLATLLPGLGVLKIAKVFKYTDGLVRLERAGKVGNRVFWSGSQAAKDAAASYALANGSKTLEMTTAGRLLQRIPRGRVNDRLTKPLWDLASAVFAGTARGEAHVFIGENFRGADSVFGRIEGPLLNFKGTPIVQHFGDAF